MIADDADSSSLIDRLREAGETAREADQAVRDLATTCRAYNASWADIGRALGVSKQAAQQRFGRA